MIPTIYGQFEEEQFSNYKEKLHKKLFWLLLYKDPKEADKYTYVNFEKYYGSLMRELDGLNEIISYPKEMVEIMALLEAALIESRKEDFDYRVYRKLVLDAHHLVDDLEEVDL